MLRFVLVLVLAAVVVYGVFWVIDRRRQLPPANDVRRGPIGPDDDDDFLRELDRRPKN
mgnify:CR=1 FL=1